MRVSLPLTRRTRISVGPVGLLVLGFGLIQWWAAIVVFWLIVLILSGLFKAADAIAARRDRRN
jgi:hypothetical protein